MISILIKIFLKAYADRIYYIAEYFLPKLEEITKKNGQGYIKD